MAPEDVETAVPEAKADKVETGAEAAEVATTAVPPPAAEITEAVTTAEEMVVDATVEVVTQQVPHLTSTTSTQIRHHSKTAPP